MRIALVGTGQMGQAVEAVATERGHTIAARFDADRPFLDASPDDLTGVDVLIDFSLPDVAADHLRRYAEDGLTAVVGTTGWYDRLDDVERWMAESDGAVLYAPNFSLGVALLRRAVEAVAPLVDRLEEFDVAVHEVHHARKADSPSGTAHMLAEVLLERIARKEYAEPEAQHGRIDPEALHVSSQRLGGVAGEHTVSIDGPHDHLSLTHRAHSRQGFAAGAVRAAEWLPGRRGLFTLEDLLNDWLAG